MWMAVGQRKKLRMFAHPTKVGRYDTRIQNNLELSIISIAPFTVCFPEKKSHNQKCQNALFLVSFSGMITLELRKNKVMLPNAA